VKHLQPSPRFHGALEHLNECTGLSKCRQRFAEQEKKEENYFAKQNNS